MRVVIYVGTCGFAYRDWIGPFYPAKMRSAEMLPWYARRFCAVEIDMSTYGVPDRAVVQSMHARTPDTFRFSFKAPRTVTHPPDATYARVHDDARALVEAVQPLREARKLAAVLIQFPNSFKPGAATQRYVEDVVAVFSGIATVLEFRHRAWQTPETLAMARSLGAAWCNVDMPSLEGLLHASADVSSRIGYVRLHGRNAALWWQGSNVTRYDYRYSERELIPWADRVADMEAQAEETYVLFNNHAHGNAARNAQMLADMLDERYGEAAPAHVAHAAGGNPEQTALFSEDE